MAAPPDYGPNHFTITVNGTTISNHAPVEGLIGGSIVNSTVHLQDYGVNLFTNFTVFGTTPSLHAPVQLFSRLVVPNQTLPAAVIPPSNIPLPSDAQFRKLKFSKYARKWHKPWIVPNRKRAWALSIDNFVTRVTWAGLEITHGGNGGVRVTWAGIEAVHSGNGDVRTTWAGIEVVRSIDIITYIARPYKKRHPWLFQKKHGLPHRRVASIIAPTTRRPVVFVTA